MILKVHIDYIYNIYIATGSVTPTGGLYSNEARIEAAVALAQEKGYINPQNEAKIAKAVSIAEETANAIRSGASVSEVLTGLKKRIHLYIHTYIYIYIYL